MTRTVTHLRIRWTSGSSSKDEVKLKAIEKGHKFIAALQRTNYVRDQGYPGYVYTSFPDASSLLQTDIYRQPEAFIPSKNMYEVLGTYRKPYVDVEWVSEVPEPQEALDLVLEAIITTIMGALPVPVRREDFCIAIGTRSTYDDEGKKTKHSYHINLVTHAVEYLELKAFMKGLTFPTRPDLGEEGRPQKSVVDTLVYTFDRQWRLVGSSKEGSDTPLVIISGHTFLQSVCSDIDGLPIIELPKVPGGEERKCRLSSSSAIVPQDSPLCQRVTSLLRQLGDPHTIATHEKPDGLIVLSSAGHPRECLVSVGTTHGSNNAFVTRRHGTLQYHCNSAGCQGKSVPLGGVSEEEGILEEGGAITEMLG